MTSIRRYHRPRRRRRNWKQWNIHYVLFQSQNKVIYRAYRLQRWCAGSATDKFVSRSWMCLLDACVCVCVCWNGSDGISKAKQISASSKWQNNTISNKPESLSYMEVRALATTIESNRKIIGEKFWSTSTTSSRIYWIADTIVSNESFTFVTNASQILLRTPVLLNLYELCVVECTWAGWWVQHVFSSEIEERIRTI